MLVSSRDSLVFSAADVVFEVHCNGGAPRATTAELSKGLVTPANRVFVVELRGAHLRPLVGQS